MENKSKEQVVLDILNGMILNKKFDINVIGEKLGELFGNQNIDQDMLPEIITQAFSENADPYAIKLLYENAIVNKNNSTNIDNIDLNNIDFSQINLKDINNIQHTINNDSDYIPDPINDEKIIGKDLEKAHEMIPEFFTPIDMLYVPCSINDHYITAFVDTGAQCSIMNLETAVKCGLYDRIDTRSKSVVHGVGTQMAVGYLYNVELIFGSYVLPCNFMVLRKAPNIIIGLNIMKAHGIVLDIKNNCLCINNDNIHFLKQNEIEDGAWHDELNKNS